ncbi:MAG: WD40/YVTN/BNR-like repeat-containing protein, partial [Flavobacteriales bacterium]
MKRILLVISVLFPSATSLFSQWSDVTVANMSNPFSIEFFSGTTGILAGYNMGSPFPDGKIFRTTNGGTTWSQVHIMDTSSYYGSVKLNSSTAFVVGQNNYWAYIAKTTDAGATWVGTTYYSEATVLRDIQFPTPTIGYITGGSGDNVFMKTTDGGNTWNVLPLIGVDVNTHSLWFTSATTGYLSSSENPASKIYKTTDGGSTWTEILNSVPGTIYGMCFSSVNNGYFVTDGGHIYRTTNAGTSWTSSQPSTTVLNDIFFTTTTTGYAVGLSGFGGSLILKTTDGGSTWTPDYTTSFGIGYLNEIRFTPAGAFATGSGG